MSFLAKISPIMRVLIGLGLGIFTGLFVGEPAGVLSIGGDAYIRLLQMTVLPYVIVSLVAGLGGLNAEMARRIGVRGGGMILVLWGVTLLTLTCIPLAYPDWTAATFFSTSLLEAPTAFDPLSLYIPANFFYSLANTIVPAVVLFAIALGLALISVEDKAGLLRGLGNLSNALMKIASYVGKVAPIGIFMIAAAAAGTLQVEELNRLQIFLWAYLTAWCLLAFVTLPGLVAWATPFSYREVLRESQLAMVTAFATGTVLVVLPLIAERCKALLEEHGIDSSEAQTTIDVMVPTAYSFPSAGTLLGLGFVLFAGWYIGSPLSVGQYPSFTIIGALTSFGSMAVAIPFMLDFFALPADLFQLYLLGSVVTARFATALAAMHGVVACLLGVVAVVGLLRGRALLQASAASVAVSGIVLAGLGLGLTRAIPYVYTGEEAFTSMTLLTDPVDVHQGELGEPLDRKDRARSRLDVIVQRGTLRAGFLPHTLPYAYLSTAGDVVGFDIEILHGMAKSLGVNLAITRLDWEEAAVALEDGRLDVLVGGLVVTPQRSMEVSFTESYLDKALGFAVLDSRRDEFPSLTSMKLARGLKVAVPGKAYAEGDIRKLLPNAELVMLDSPRPYFRGEVEGADLLVMAAQSASAWTLIYPEYSVIIPTGLRSGGMTSFALSREQREMAHWFDTWLELADKGGLLERLERYWIQGQRDEHRLPRWSIMKDVLHWGQTDPG